MNPNASDTPNVFPVRANLEPESLIPEANRVWRLVQEAILGPRRDAAEIIEGSPEFSEQMLTSQPWLRKEFDNCLNRALGSHHAQRWERSIIESLFDNIGKLAQVFRFISTNQSLNGRYCSSSPLEYTENISDYFNFVVNPEHFRVQINYLLLEDPIDLSLTLRHELDHVAHHLLTILRSFENTRQFHTEVYNGFFWKKTEFFAFYRHVNYAIEQKWFGAPIDWVKIMKYHTGSLIAGAGASEDYQGVVNHMEGIYNTRNKLYNLLMPKHGANSQASNRYGAILGNGMHIFEAFCLAIPFGVHAAKNEQDLEIFLSYVCRVGLCANSLDDYRDWIFNPGPGVSGSQAYQSFRQYYQLASR